MRVWGLVVCAFGCGVNGSATKTKVDSSPEPDAKPDLSQESESESEATCPAPIFVGAGDISDLQDADELTASLLDKVVAENPIGCVNVFTAGDNAYPNGSADNFADFYEPTWGRHKTITRPTPGNHEYQTPNATGYFEYFGATAHAKNNGSYSYDIGRWHILAINSVCLAQGFCDGAAQQAWLKKDLALRRTGCQLAYWHHPRWSSGAKHGSDSSMQPVWQLLADAGVDVVVQGHDHGYERFAPMSASGKRDSTAGIRAFVVGTGGARLYSFGAPLKTSDVHDNTSHGVLKFTLRADSYDWQFLPADGSFSDSGTATCH